MNPSTHYCPTLISDHPVWTLRPFAQGHQLVRVRFRELTRGPNKGLLRAEYATDSSLPLNSVKGWHMWRGRADRSTFLSCEVAREAVRVTGEAATRKLARKLAMHERREQKRARARCLNYMTRRLTCFPTFGALINARGGFRPTLPAGELQTEYDLAQARRGDPRRAYLRR